MWEEDVRLMREAGVNLVSVGIFSWARIQPAEDTWDFAWLDEVLDLLHEGGVGVDLATATASPPPWLTTAHPEILPVTATGETLWPGRASTGVPPRPSSAGTRCAWSGSWPPATPAIRHSSPGTSTTNWSCHNVYDYSDDAARAFRDWLRARYTTLDALNSAWGTAFWSQRYTDWEQILPPRLAASHPNPTQQVWTSSASRRTRSRTICAPSGRSCGRSRRASPSPPTSW
ncbi:Beta-galactosidase OS=Streptomyces griseomycini OX=66895 GN=FHS37_005355 PE=3 SV=1 [Streptomyces griseomycini]